MPSLLKKRASCQSANDLLIILLLEHWTPKIPVSFSRLSGIFLWGLLVAEMSVMTRVLEGANMISAGSLATSGSESSPQTIPGEGRVYGGGPHKLESREPGSVLAKRWSDYLTEDLIDTISIVDSLPYQASDNTEHPFSLCNAVKLEILET